VVAGDETYMIYSLAREAHELEPPCPLGQSAKSPVPVTDGRSQGGLEIDD
jgi:hypothetical protein